MDAITAGGDSDDAIAYGMDSDNVQSPVQSPMSHDHWRFTSGAWQGTLLATPEKADLLLFLQQCPRFMQLCVDKKYIEAS